MSATITPQSTISTGTWKVDPIHSTVGFSVKHLGIATVRGEFKEFEGALEIDGDLSSARAYGAVVAASVDTNQPDRDAHLRSPDFFDAEIYPELSFESTSIEPVDDDTFKVTGELTLHGVTQELELTAEIQGSGPDMSGNDRVGLELTGQLSRADYGMKFNQALGSGNAVVSDKVKLVLDLSAVREA